VRDLAVSSRCFDGNADEWLDDGEVESGVPLGFGRGLRDPLGPRHRLELADALEALAARGYLRRRW
jgi:hypothetical protein